MKTFLSIGSGPGIGLATAERFAREGYRVVLTSRNQDYLGERVKALEAAGHAAVGRHVDASDIASVVKLVHDVESEFGSIDVLHFNAAALHEDTIDQQSIEGFVQDLRINIGAAFAAVKEASRGMVSRQNGTLLLTGGGYGISPQAGSVSLGVGKAGLRNLVLGLFESFKDKGVHIATVTVATQVTDHPEQTKEIADLFWSLHTQPQNLWTAETVYSGSGSNGKPMPNPLSKVIYTAHTHTTGGRDGASRSDDGRLEVALSSPGTPGTGTNPEQMFAAGYSACFIGAIKAVAAKARTTLPPDLAVDTEVDLGTIPNAYGIAVRMSISLPGMERAAAESLVQAAHLVCPYSNATRGNIGVTLTVV